jgi:hypothetical protein
MSASEDKRYGNRFACKVPIVVSPFNSRDAVNALLVDYCMNGITFISKDAFLKGTAIVVRIVYPTLKDSCYSEIESLPSIRIGEVKWCRERPDEASTAYEVGISYYQTYY